jgi:hypothetical protein
MSDSSDSESDSFELYETTPIKFPVMTYTLMRPPPPGSMLCQKSFAKTTVLVRRAKDLVPVGFSLKKTKTGSIYVVKGVRSISREYKGTVKYECTGPNNKRVFIDLDHVHNTDRYGRPNKYVAAGDFVIKKRADFDWERHDKMKKQEKEAAGPAKKEQPKKRANDEQPPKEPVKRRQSERMLAQQAKK